MHQISASPNGVRMQLLGALAAKPQSRDNSGGGRSILAIKIVFFLINGETLLLSLWFCFGSDRIAIKHSAVVFNIASKAGAEAIKLNYKKYDVNRFHKDKV